MKVLAVFNYDFSWYAAAERGALQGPGTFLLQAQRCRIEAAVVAQIFVTRPISRRVDAQRKSHCRASK